MKPTQIILVLLFAVLTTAKLSAQPTCHELYTQLEGDEGRPGGMIWISVVRGGDLSVSSSVDYSAAPGTAFAGQDYVPVTGTIKFVSRQRDRSEWRLVKA